MTQCSARHPHQGTEHYCIKDMNHPVPHECEWGHTWGIRIIPDEPVLPYAEPGGEGATAGWSGSDTSHERAERERDDGTVAERQRQTLVTLDRAGGWGMTWKELGEQNGWHHGQSSSVLSVLHKEGRIARLVEKRDKCHVYVLNEHVEDRDTQPHGGRRKRDDSAERKLAAIRAMAEEYALLDPTQVLEVLDGE